MLIGPAGGDGTPLMATSIFNFDLAPKEWPNRKSVTRWPSNESIIDIFVYCLPFLDQIVPCQQHNHHDGRSAVWSVLWTSTLWMF